MKGKNKPDNLEDFFKPLGEYEEDPGVDFWDRIVPVIPNKPTSSGFVYRGWMIIMAFLGGLLLSSLFFYWQSNTILLNNLEIQLVEKNSQIDLLQQEVVTLQNWKAINTHTSENKTDEIITANKAITRPKSVLNPKMIGSPEKSKLNASIQTDKEPFIKLEIAQKTAVVATASTIDGSWLQSRFSPTTQDFSQLFLATNKKINIAKQQRLLFDNQLISNSFFEGENSAFTEDNIVEKDAERESCFV